MFFIMIFFQWKHERRLTLRWANYPKYSRELAVDSDVSKEECDLCGLDGNGFYTIYMGKNNLGIINFVTLELLYIEINQSLNDEKCEKPGISVFMKYDGNGGFKNEVVTNTERGYATVSVTEDGKVDPEKLLNILCEDCLKHVCGYAQEMNFTGLGVVNYKTGEIYMVSKSDGDFEMGDYYVSYECENTVKKLWVYYCPELKNRGRAMKRG